MTTEHEQHGTQANEGAATGETKAKRPPAPSHAERSRTLAAMQQHATLCTLARDPAGHPYGSLVVYALDAAGQPLLLLSGLAEHTRNLELDARASLLVSEVVPPGGDVLAVGRLTLLGRAVRLSGDGDDAGDARARYLAAHPRAELYFGMRDFGLFRLAVESARWIGGFGRMSWVSAEEYRLAEADPLAPHAADIIAHMNDDHAAALLVYARAHAGHAHATEARMTAVDRYGIDMVVTTPEGPRPARVAFAGPVATPDEARRELVRLAAEGRKRLG